MGIHYGVGLSHWNTGKLSSSIGGVMGGVGVLLGVVYICDCVYMTVYRINYPYLSKDNL